MSKGHDFYLDQLVNRIHDIGIDRTELEWISKDPRWFRNGTCDLKPMCDIIGGYEDGRGLAIELKSTPAKREKAISQVRSGARLLTQMGYKGIDKKVVYYSGGKYESEIIS